MLDKYFEGETSLEEEQGLKTYFNSNDVAEDLRMYQGLFQFFKAEKKLVLPEQRSAKITSLYATSESTKSSSKFRIVYQHIAKIAAVLLVAICAYWFMPTTAPTEKQAINWSEYEVENEEEAIEKTIAALRLVSAKLNGGAKRAIKEVHHVQAAAKVFKK